MQTITQHQADYVGIVKGNQAELQTLLDAWVAAEVLSPGRSGTPFTMKEAEIPHHVARNAKREW